jgi:hypothetical protein
MYSLLRPHEKKLSTLLEEARRLPYSTPLDPLRDEPDKRWNTDHYETTIEIPKEVSAERVRAVTAEIIRTLAFFPPWMIAVRKGDTVLVGARALGILGLFADRIYSERDEGDDAKGSFDIGFSYATLQGHFETGVEAFRAKRESGVSPVRFSIDAVSRVSGPIKAVAGWVGGVREIQRRFGRDTPACFAEVLRKRLSMER